MIRPHSRSIQCKYRSWLVYCGLVLYITLPLVQIQASPDALYGGKGVKTYLGVVSSAKEDPQPRQLEPGKPIERELAGAQSHSYRMALTTGQYAKLVVDQHGIDLEVKLYGSDGKQVTEFEFDRWANGQETASWVAESTGSYRVDVLARYKNRAAGRYEIQLVELRIATEDDRALHEAVKLFTESRRLFVAYKFNEARPLGERVLEIRERVLGSEHPDVAHAIYNLANIHHYNNDYARAELFYQRTLAIWEKALGPDHLKVASALFGLANLYRDKSEYARAEPLFQRALTIKEEALGPEHPGLCNTLNNLALLYINRGDFAKAEPLYQRALTIGEKELGPEHPAVAKYLSNLANLHRERGEYATAEPIFQRALSINEKVFEPEHPEVASSLNNLAIVYTHRGNYARAEPLFQRALTIGKKVLGLEHPDVASYLTNLADLYMNRGDYTKADPLYLQALSIKERVLGPEHPAVALLLHNLALFYGEQGDYAKAELLFQRALAIYKKILGPEHPDVAYSLAQLGLLYKDRGNYAKAESLLQSALTIGENTFGSEHPEVAFFLNNLAIIHRMRGNYAKAERLLQRGLSIWEKSLGSGHPDVSENLAGLALLYAAKSDIAQAVKFLSRANNIDEGNFALNLATGSERQKLVYLSGFSDRTDFTLSLHSQAAPNDPQALDLAFMTLLRRKGRGLDAMTDTIATLRRHATPQDKALFDRLSEARSQLAELTLKEPDATEPNAYRTRLETLNEKVEELEGQLSSRSAPFHNQTQPVTLATVQAALPTDSALVEFAYFTPLDPKTENSKPSRYLAYLLPAQGQPKWVDLGEASLIDRAVNAWRKALRDPTRLDVKRLARTIDEIVMQPVRSLLSEMPGEARRLLIAPDGLLNLIPFAALVDEQNRYLIERYSISYLTCGRDLLRLQTSEPSKGATLVVANPDFGRFATIAMRGGRSSGKSRNQSRSQIDLRQIFFQPLPATEDEALAIKALHPHATVLQREDATEAALKQASRPQILHIATHGFFLNYHGPPRTKDTPLRIASSAQTTGYTLQLEATPALETAQETVKRLWTQGVDAYIIKSSVKGKGTFFRVRVGNFPSLAEANKYGADLQEKKSANDLFVARYEPPQEDLIELAPTIPGALTKLANSTSTPTPPTNSQPAKESPSGLRLSKFVAQVKDPLLRSGLALAGANHGKSGDDDGVLTALEAAYLDLLGTKLVVLSACDTGVGEVKNGEGVQGLRRALVLAGSESQVMSLWPVSDEATKDLMIPYYKALQQGEGRGEGLRQVQLRMLRGRKDRRHPFYWAAFIQSGEWANLEGQR
jgi:CHAT domain-containing protein/Tfp pilus assembly protein PilF